MSIFVCVHTYLDMSTYMVLFVVSAYTNVIYHFGLSAKHHDLEAIVDMAISACPTAISIKQPRASQGKITYFFG